MYEKAVAGREIVLEIVRDVLNVDDLPLDVGFFDLGGSSLQAAEVLDRVAAALGSEPPLGLMYAAATLGDFADAAAVLAAGPIAPDSSSTTSYAPTALDGHGSPQDGRHRASFNQESWYRNSLVTGRPLSTMSAAFRILGPLDIDRLSSAVDCVVARNDSLRTSFIAEGELLTRSVVERLDFLVGVCDAAAEELDDVSWIHARLEPLDPSTAPLMRIHVRRVSDTEHVLLLHLSHLVTDGQSMQLILQQLGDAYGSGSPPQDRPGTSFGEWAEEQRRLLSPSVLGRLVEQWRELLGSDPAALGTPLPGYQPDAPRSRPGQREFRLDMATTQGLRGAARTAGVSLYAATLSAFARVVCAEARRPWLICQTSIANRQRRGRDVVGPLSHRLLLKLDLTGVEDDPAGSARRAHDTLARSADLGSIPHNVLQDLLWPDHPSLHRTAPTLYFAQNPAYESVLPIPGVRATPIHLADTVAPQNTQMWLTEQDTGLTGVFCWDDERLPGELARRIVDGFLDNIRALAGTSS